MLIIISLLSLLLQLPGTLAGRRAEACQSLCRENSGAVRSSQGWPGRTFKPCWLDINVISDPTKLRGVPVTTDDEGNPIHIVINTRDAFGTFSWADNKFTSLNSFLQYDPDGAKILYSRYGTTDWVKTDFFTMGIDKNPPKNAVPMKSQYHAGVETTVTEYLCKPRSPIQPNAKAFQNLVGTTSPEMGGKCAVSGLVNKSWRTLLLRSYLIMVNPTVIEETEQVQDCGGAKQRGWDPYGRDMASSRNEFGRRY